MSSQGTASRPHGVLLSRLLWPTAVLFASTLWVVFATILWTGDTVNEVALDRQKAQLQSALQQQLTDLRRLLSVWAAQNARPDQAGDVGPGGRQLAKLIESADSLREFDTVVLIRRDWTVLGGVQAGRPVEPDAADLLRPILGKQVKESLAFASGVAALEPEASNEARLQAIATARILLEAGNVLATVVLPLWRDGAADELTVLLAVKELSGRGLSRIAAAQGFEQIERSVALPGDHQGSYALRDGRGEVAGYLTWISDRPGDMLRERLVPLTLVAFLLIAVLFGLVAGYLHWLSRDLAKTEAQSRELLGRDPLSGLANRLLFGERLDRELDRLKRTRRGLAVLFIDLDRFKDVNDTYGHQAGDDLIQLVAQRLVNLLRTSDTIARFGGDEFAIIQTSLASEDDARALARRILDALTRPFALAHTQVIIGASIGIAIAPEHGDSREALMGLADTALYQSKSEGRNRFSVFQTRMDETIRMRKVVEEDLRRAIVEDELVLHYQPLFSADGLRVVAVEALVRWPHPTRGLISPGEFIPIAEERGLVIPLGEWVLRRACLDGQRWPGLRIAVNVSAIQFRHRDFVAGVVALLEETGLDPSRLELELTEGVVVEDADAAENAMIDLRALGIHLALDDFGTGYSSLIYLRRFAFDTIKIDRSFLESMEATGESAILVHSMVHLGRALGLTVTAEGVETLEQQRFLQALGCHQLQGYLFSRPLPAGEIDALVARCNLIEADAA